MQVVLGKRSWRMLETRRFAYVWNVRKTARPTGESASMFCQDGWDSKRSVTNQKSGWINIWGFPEMGISKNGLLRKIPLKWYKMDDDWGTPIFGNHQVGILSALLGSRKAVTAWKIWEFHMVSGINIDINRFWSFWCCIREEKVKFKCCCCWDVGTSLHLTPRNLWEQNHEGYREYICCLEIKHACGIAWISTGGWQVHLRWPAVCRGPTWSHSFTQAAQEQWNEGKPHRKKLSRKGPTCQWCWCFVCFICFICSVWASDLPLFTKDGRPCVPFCWWEKPWETPNRLWFSAHAWGACVWRTA